jgi:hypothetical protein
MDTQKVDLLIQFAAAVAAQEDDFLSRSLGPIHFIKYVYLADLAYFERKGESFTGAKWRFHKFGPYAYEVLQRIEPALVAIGAEKKTFPSRYGDEDFCRWTVRDRDLVDELERTVSLIPSLTIRNAVHRFTSDTPSLLNHVYLTKPMLTASPGEGLIFEKKEPSVPSAAQGKDIKKKLNKSLLTAAKKSIQEKIAAKKLEKSQSVPFHTSRYDEVFLDGQNWLDSLAGEEIVEYEGEVVFSPDIWKSKARFDPDVS